ncbi:hypothetical protein E8D34_06490 [Nocardioides sp. GY 10113]|uniref:hypothetical protein n=1 Tax=Nocardioides sp. GY 10113 TaxID=2569761 RepID=UPI0010A809A2|nr:hypothetical protein [Nocardioides sp. GY 10113]TIC87937.1 hypothetical protein E8D34_06490 [Nocardioides sp. GY 10113]
MLIVRRVPRCAARGAAPVGAGLAAAETVTAFTVAHRAAGGVLPGVEALLAVALLVYGAGLLVLGRRARLRSVLPGMVVAQLAVHAATIALSPASPRGHAHHEVATGGVAGLTGPMVAAHLAAALVTALAWSLRRRAVEVLVAWSAPGALPAPLRCGAARMPVPLRVWSAWRRGAAATRGPPTLPARLPA